jgi:tetratricopeptide (TPR) repeat protein
MLEQAIALHAQGRFPEAEQAYRAILAREPDNAEAGYRLGMLAMDAGLPDAAVPIFQQVLALRPGNAAVLADLGAAYARAGHRAEAEASFAQALALDANCFNAHFQRGIAQMDADPDAALISFDHAIAAAPDQPAAYNYRGMVLTHLQRLDAALEDFERALALAPDNAMAHSNLGAALVRLNRHAEAVPRFEAAAALQPGDAGMHYNLGDPLMFLGRLEEALAAYDRALAINPNMADAHVNRGIVLTNLGRCDEALATLDRAIALAPGLKSARIARSGALVGGNRIEEALAHNRALAQNPDFRADAEFHSAFLLLQRGDWAEGWKLYESRRHKDNPTVIRSYPQPEWLGEGDVAGKCLYIYGEQGLGDVIMFCRYLPLLAARGAKVFFSPQDKLARLMGTLSPAPVIQPDATPPDAFDYHLPLLSLPMVFGTQPDSVPADIPYLKAEPALVEKWRARIGKDGFRIGVCWTGSANIGMGIDRSFPLEQLAPIAALPGVRLISLQKLDGLEQLAALPPGMRVETLGEDFDSGPDAFVDTAAAMPGVDLVISCDTSVAHLAGALGVPCWTALKHHPEWRWALKPDSTPWYPGMTLFRQAEPGDWSSVFAAMTEKLKAQRA